jgi:hypothetical protein
MHLEANDSTAYLTTVATYTLHLNFYKFSHQPPVLTCGTFVELGDLKVNQGGWIAIVIVA